MEDKEGITSTEIIENGTQGIEKADDVETVDRRNWKTYRRRNRH